MARHILLHRQKGSRFPHRREIAKALGLPVREVHKALRMLARMSFVTMTDRRRPAEYALVRGYEQSLEGLGFLFHTATLDKKDQFSVP